MAVEVSLNTPLAEALTNAVQGRLMDNGWASGGLDDSALGEYIILMLVNGKTQDQIAAELSTDLLSLPPEDTAPAEFAQWLFEQAGLLKDRLNRPETQQPIQDQFPSDAQGASIRGAALRQFGNDAIVGDTDMNEAMDEPQSDQIPTGPKALRNGPRAPIGNRRMVGQLNKAMDRSADGALHRVRFQQGTERVNMHNRPPPKGPKNDQVRANRFQNNGRPGAANGPVNGSAASSMMQMNPQQQMQLMAMLEQQAQMMAQIMPQQMQGMIQPANNSAYQNGARSSGRSLFDRVDGPSFQSNGSHNPAFRRKSSTGAHLNSHQMPPNGDLSSSMEVESSQPMEASPETVCKFNLKCTKKDCPFAHQSPAAPPGTTVDVHDSCPFGAACKNKKCTGRHPSPFQKVAHASEQDCKFYPNCTNSKCPFRHPTMPMCRNGADCSREGCKFTHVKIMCKYNPCLNPDCVYKHEEGQKRGKYGDKVWTADQDQEKEHVSERKFVDDEMGDEEFVKGQNNIEDSGHGGSQHSAELVT